MFKPTRSLLTFAALATALSLSACGRSDEAELAELDNEIVGNETDPAVTSALQDQILVDPTLSQQSNRNAVRSASGPAQAQYPTAGPRSSTTVRGGEGCAADLDYAMGWAERLPPAFAVYPGSRVTEAAANNRGDCRLRVVTYTTGEPSQRLLDWYHNRAVRAGYTSEHQLREGDHVLAGTNEIDGGAFFLIVTPTNRGSEVALITNGAG
jgi:hypothetical protein